ncbi:haloacid dehalogenase [Streptomyces sulfonofaciens]|uniref:Haloacid dehalogenase n=1 Tax=Streptomyces sulfonofaciens TaxID=68272 RepID=A0A919G9D1_9ACTN|nr:haloacid dehalogenase type II [Streptomyces sulfonofaciens]GHH79665.1 haloacid dehalogenase [Streptomyces sulfonofaciens]
MAHVIAFDVNETLLDLSTLDEPFRQAFGSAAFRGQWFASMLQLSFVGGLTGSYVDFTTAQRAALHMLAQREGTTLTEGFVEGVVERMSALRPHPEVPEALRRLAGTGLAVVALTNSVQRVAEAQLANAGIRGLFARVVSADGVRRLKPAPEPYLGVARSFGVPPADVRLVAAHSWDVTGALHAGCRAAFVARPGQVLSPIGPQPDIVGPDVAAVVDRIIDTDLGV